MKATYEIPEANFATLRVRIEKLNRKARRLRLREVTLREVGSCFVDYKEDGLDRRYRQLTIEVEGENPHFQGWQLLGTLEHTESGNLLRIVPGFEEAVPAKYRTADRVCDHCKTQRNRKDTYLVRHEDGRIAQVGRSCISAYLGGVDPHQLAQLAEFFKAVDDLFAVGDGEERGPYGVGRAFQYVPLLQVLAWTRGAIRAYGWLSKTKAREWGKTATAEIVQNHLFPSPRQTSDRNWKEEHALLAPTEHDGQLAEAALAWVRALPADETIGNDYLWNLHVLCEEDEVRERQLGLACSIVAAYDRAMGVEREKKERPESQHVGTVGERLTLELTVEYSRTFEGDYGPRTLVGFVDKAGNSFKWFATGYQSETYADGTEHRVAATVKKHDEYKGRKQTELSRVAYAPTLDEKKLKAARKLQAARLGLRYGRGLDSFVENGEATYRDAKNDRDLATAPTVTVTFDPSPEAAKLDKAFDKQEKLVRKLADARYAEWDALHFKATGQRLGHHGTIQPDAAERCVRIDLGLVECDNNFGPFDVRDEALFAAATADAQAKANRSGKPMTVRACWRNQPWEANGRSEYDPFWPYSVGDAQFTGRGYKPVLATVEPVELEEDEAQLALAIEAAKQMATEQARKVEVVKIKGNDPERFPFAPYALRVMRNADGQERAETFLTNEVVRVAGWCWPEHTEANEERRFAHWLDFVGARQRDRWSGAECEEHGEASYGGPKRASAIEVRHEGERVRVCFHCAKAAWREAGGGIEAEVRGVNLFTPELDRLTASLKGDS